MNEDFDQVDQEDPIPLPKGFTPIKKSGSEIPLPKGFEPVKKKVSIADVGMVAKGGGQVGVSKTPSEEKTPETAEQKLSKLGLNITFQPKEKLQYSGTEPVTDFLNKLTKEPDYIDLSNSYEVGRLSGMIDAKSKTTKPVKASVFVSDEMVKRAYPEYKKVSDETEKVVGDLKNAISDVAAQNAFNKIVSKKDLSQVTRDDFIEAGLEYTKQVAPSQWNRNVEILEGGKDLGDENKYNLEKAGAAVLLNKAQGVVQNENILQNISQLDKETDAAHPKFAVAKAWEIISAYNHKKDNKSTNGWFRTRPSLLLVEKWLEEPELKEMFAGNEVGYEILKNQLKSLPNEQKVFDAEDVSISGGLNRFTQSIVGGIENIGNIFDSDAKRQQSNLNPTLGRGTLTGNYKIPGESNPLLQRLQQLKDKEKQEQLTSNEWKEYDALNKSTKVRSGWDKFKDDTFDTLGQVVLQAALTKGVGAGGKLVTSAKAPMLLKTGISTALISYDQSRKNAVYNFPGDDVKQNIYTGAMTAANILSERIFKDEKVFNAFKKGFDGELTTMLKNLSAQNISKQEVKNLLVDNAIKYGGRVIADANKNAFEEAVVQAADEGLNSTMSASDYDETKALKNIADTYVTTLYSMGAVSLLSGIKKNDRADEFNSVAFYRGVLNPGKTQQDIIKLYETGEITEQEKDEKLNILTKAVSIIQSEPPKIAAQPTKKRAEYLINTLNAELKKEQLDVVTDKNQAEEINKQIEDSEKKAAEIYNSLTPEQEIIKKSLGEIKDPVYKEIAENAANDPQTAAQFMDELKSQATGMVQGEADFGNAKRGITNTWGKTLSDFVAPEQPIELSIEPKAEAGSVGVGGDVESTAKALEEVAKTKPTLWDKIKETVKSVGKKLGIVSNADHINNFNTAKAEWDKLSSREKKLKRADYELDDLHHTEGGYYKVGNSLIDLDLNSNHLKLLLENNKFLNVLNKLGVTKIHGENRPAEEMFAHYSDGKIHLNNNSAFENIRQVTNAMSHELGHHEWTKLTKEERDYVRSLPLETGMAKHYEAQEKNGGKQTSASLQEENFADYVMQYFQGKLYGDEALLNKIPTKLREIFDNKYSDLLKDNEHSDIAEAYHKAKVDGSNPELIKAVEDLLGKPQEQKNKLTEQKDAEVKEAERANQQSQQQATKESKPIIESEKNSNGAGKEPPKPPVENKMDESSGESNLDYMANNVPETGEVEAYLSGDTIKKHTKESPENNQERGVMELRQSLEHGIETIKEAKRVFGEDYVEKTLDYIDKSKMGVSNKALMYVSLENELGKEKITNPEKAQEISKLQSLVYEKSQAFARENSKALNYQRLRKFAQAGYDISKVTDNFFSTEELVARRTLNKAVEANADVINEAYAAQETGALTPEVEKLINEGIAKEVERLYEQLPKEKKSIAEKAIKALEAAQAKIRSRTYDAGLGVPVAFVDAGITVTKLAIKAGVKIADAIEMGIAKIKEKLGDKKWYKEDEFRKDLQDVFKPVEEIAQKTKPVKDIVKEALIEKGFGREINVKGEKRNILDWKKLAGAAGSISNIRKNVNEVLQQKGWAGLSDTQKGVIKEDFIKEYVALRESVISKAQTELAKRNKETVTPEQKTAAKKLAELYTFGIFDGNFDEYENALNKALGAKVSEQGFNDAKKIARALENIYKSTFKGVLLNDVSAKSAIEKLEDQIRILLFREAKAQGNFNLKAANIVRTYFETSQTMLLNNMKQAFENPLSGLSQNAIDAIEGIQAGTSNKELRSQRREAMKNIYKDMVINGGITYGKIESQFVNRQHLDDLVNRMSDNKIYHGIMSTVTGKATLNAMDAMFKLAITEKKFATNLIKILTHKSNPKAMSKEDALKFVTEKLTGQTYKDAQVTAKKVIEEINKNAGVELIKPEQTQIDRFANDIVKASLEMGGKITTEQITAAYNAAYKAAGLGLGHEANNPLSGMIKGYSAKLEGDINRALKDKEWNRAAMLIYKSVLFRNILNPFVGGGTNWLVLKLEKAGLGLATGLIYKFGSKSQLDLSSELGQKQLEARLYNHARYKDNFMRGLVGGIVSTSGYLLYRGLSDEDEEKYRKMRKENPWAARYLDVVTPEVTLAEMGIKDNKFKQYIEKSYNRGDAFDPVTKVIKGVDYAIKGEKGKMWGAFGEAVGTKTNAPLPWRLFKDGQVLYQGITGQDPYHGNYKPSDGFLSGVTQGGVLEWLGVPRSVSESQGNTINLKYKNKKDEYINRDATIEENKKYEDEKVKETNRMLSEYEKGKKVTINRYGEVSLKSDSKGKEVDYNKLTETQQKELLSAIKESAGDYSKSKLLDEIK